MYTGSTNCARCGRPKQSKSVGSLTQWIAACNCDIAASTNKYNTAEQPTICVVCGKRVSAGRAGSFTQWVFRQDLCSCAQPQLNVKSAQEAASQQAEADPEEDQEKEEELLVDQKDFPLERYKPLRVLGQGASGLVYLCRDRLLGKRVAVKTLHQLSQVELVSFQLEAKANSKLDHPNIIRVLDFGVTEGSAPYMVMEYCSGIGLDSIIQTRGYLDWQSVFKITMEVCEALEYSHENGVLHRDLKPSNILVDDPDSQNPTVCLIDFGVAQSNSSSQDDSGRDTIVGTPAYMSPDTTTGRKYSERSEIYSVGCIMFECLVGRPPFASDTALGLLNMHAEMPPQALAQANEDADIPDSVQTIVSECLEKNPEHRIQSATSLKTALRLTLKSETNTLAPDDIVSETAPLAVADKRVNSMMLPVIATIGLLLIVLIPVTFLFHSQPSTETKPAKQVKEPTVVRFGPPKTLDELYEINEKMRSARARDTIYEADLAPLVGRDIKTLLLFRQPMLGDSSCKYFCRMPLEALFIYKSNITDKGLKRIAKIDSLRSLDIGGSQISDAGVKCLSKDLVSLGIFENNRVTDRSMSHVAKMKNLWSLNISGTEISDTGFALVGRLPLRVLHISSCDISDSGFSALSGNTTLEILHLGDTNVSEAGLRAIKNCHLQEINASSASRIDDSCLKFIAENWPNLRTLVIHSTAVTADGLKYLKGFRQLTELRVAVTDRDLDPILELKKIKSLNVTGSHITDRGFAKLLKMPSLEILNVQQCAEISAKALSAASSGKVKVINERLDALRDEGDFHSLF